MQYRVRNVNNMVKLVFTALAGIALLCSFQAEAQQPVPEFKVTYTLENNYITGGTADFTLAGNDENGYQLVLQTNPTGVFRFSNKGKIREAAELVSLSAPFLSSTYSYTNFGNEKRSYTTTYDRKNGLATSIRNGKSETFKIDDDAVDRLSMTLTVMSHLNENPDAKEFSVKLLEQSGTEVITFVSKGQVSLKTDIGLLKTTRIDRQRANSNRHTVTWFASIGPDDLPIPVQIEQYKRGKMSIRLKAIAFTVIE